MSAIRTAENKSHDLGTANKRFKDLYVGGIEADGAVSVASLTVGGNSVASVDNTALGDVTTASTTVAPSQAATKNYVDTQVASVIDAAPEALNTLNELAAALNDDASLGTTVTNNTGSITTNQTNIATNVTNIAANATAISSNDTDIATNASGIATNVTNISTNVTNIAANATAISSNDTDIATNASGIATNAAAIEGITGGASFGQITTNQTNIATNVTNIAANASAITSNDSDISTNASGIATNVTNIATNAAAIAAIDTSGQGTNATAIATNVTNIATNAAAISSNDTDIATNASGIATNVTNIATNAAAISSNDTDIATNVTNIATNVTNIAANATAIAAIDTSGQGTNATAIATNVTNIAANATAISSNDTDIATNVTNIATNASAISSNDTDIATNAGNISTNTTNIASNATAIAARILKSDLQDDNDFSSAASDKVASSESIKAYVDAQVSGLVDSAPAALDTLNELAAALGDDASFSTTVSTSLGEKALKTTTITAGTGLTGGGTLAADRTLNVAGLTVSEFADNSLQTSSDSFSNDDTSLMTSAAIEDKILSYGYTTASSLNLSNYMPIAGGTFTGAVEVGGNLTVRGDLLQFDNTSTAGVESVSFADKNIVIDADNDSSAVADGAGITLEGGSGSDVTLQWNAGASRLELKEGSSFASLKVDSLESTSGTVEVTASAAEKLDHSVSFALTGAVTGSVSSDLEGNSVSITTTMASDTDAVSEGSSNLYFTDARADARIAAADTDDVSEGSSNLYFTNARADARIAAADTDDLSEGSTNQYFTNARARAAISENSDQLSYNSTTGQLTYTQGNTDTVSEGSSNQYFTNSRADARIAAASINSLSDVAYTSGSDIDNYVLTYDHSSSSWGAEVVPSAPVTSVNSKSGGAVTLDTDDVGEGSSNLYTTAARTRTHFTYGTGIEHDGSGALSVTQSDINTDNVTEGSSNKFFSNSLAQNAISVTGSGLSKTDGTISLSTIPVSLGGTGATSASAARDALEVKSASDFAQGSAWKAVTSGSDTLVTMSNEVDGHSGSWKVINRLETTSSGGNITAVSLVADFQVRPSSRIIKLGSLPDTLWNIPSDGVLQLR